MKGCWNADVVKMFLEKKANCNMQNKVGRTPLMMASCSGHVECVHLFLEKGANIMSVDQDGKTAKDLALIGGNWNIVKMLHQVCII